MQAPTLGWDSVATIGLLIVGVVVLFAWLRIEAREPDPLVDPAILRGPMLGANVVAFCVPFVLTGLTVLLAIYLQTVLGYSALATGALMLPMTIPLCVGSLLSGWLLSLDRRPHRGHGRHARRRGRRLPGRGRRDDGQRVPRRCCPAWSSSASAARSPCPR